MDVTDLLELIPLILTLVLALLLRRTLIALGAGVVLGALILNDFSPVTSLKYLFNTLTAQFYQQSQWQWWHLNVLFAMLLLGIMTSLLGRSGAVDEFGHWLSARVHSRRQARMGIIGLGFLVFIDGIFSCLAVGSVGRPIARQYGMSPAQLSYMVDTTASPLCSLVPVASWGPYVMALLAAISFLPVSALDAFIAIAAVNFYAVSALVLVGLGSLFNWGWSEHIDTAAEVGATERAAGHTAHQQPQPSNTASPWPLMLPLLGLLMGALVFTLASGASLAKEPGMAAWLAAADVGAAMRNASLTAVVLAALMALWRGRGRGRGLAPLMIDMLVGLRSMALAVGILLLTWMIGALIKDLGSAARISALANDLLSPSLLLAGIFALCAIMAFATGTSWGTFAIMIPLCAQVAQGMAPELLLPALAAVMAGSVFGDHCSPISDTSILSATASGAAVHEHVTTQLPFALIAAIAALCGFQLLNLGASWGLAWALTLLTGIGLLWLWQHQRSSGNLLKQDGQA
ncbi:Na+/H+ antiporter NhaC family protein [Shewanella sp. FJAT-52076]|uniref:Na+/H+ antiporter NhaC family protein n=1 Tax=Shewanella sp. FJAT-52076 TaxID=2864202 RepID=UPI001C65DF65|nr:Na+/H+ antiporter NhaC family protein [Shewanella sp. FJAT-52076]QYJ75073.1 sodium:proton antiporter [Shewanella sp. FJAT-52076]